MHKSICVALITLVAALADCQDSLFTSGIWPNEQPCLSDLCGKEFHYQGMEWRIIDPEVFGYFCVSDSSSVSIAILNLANDTVYCYDTQNVGPGAYTIVWFLSNQATEAGPSPGFYLSMRVVSGKGQFPNEYHVKDHFLAPSIHGAED